jgi:uncharacterized MnhB-related membrane protein
VIVQVFDTILALLLVWLAWRAVSDADPLRAVVKFIVLGLMLALSWLRLGAPDVALAEAAVGSGLTGALLLVALRRWWEGRSGASPSAQGDQP